MDLPSLDRATTALRAAQLLRDEVLIGALDQLEADCAQAWASTSLAATADREQAWHTLKASHRLRAYLGALVDDGKILAARQALNPIR